MAQPSNVHNEPIIHPYRITNELKDTTSGILIEIQDRGDLLVRGFWNRYTDCIIDIRVCDVNQLSYLARKLSSIMKTAKNEFMSKKSNFGEILICFIIKFKKFILKFLR